MTRACTVAQDIDTCGARVNTKGWPRSGCLLFVDCETTGLDPRRLAGQHVGFDLGFLAALLSAHGHEPRWERHAVDVASLAFPLYTAHPELEGVSLRHVAPFLGLQPEGPIHRAAAGAELARQVYAALLARYGEAG